MVLVILVFVVGFCGCWGFFVGDLGFNWFRFLVGFCVLCFFDCGWFLELFVLVCACFLFML